jgi:hypothetical protein
MSKVKDDITSMRSELDALATGDALNAVTSGVTALLTKQREAGVDAQVTQALQAIGAVIGALDKDVKDGVVMCISNKIRAISITDRNNYNRQGTYGGMIAATIEEVPDFFEVFK